MYSERLKNEKLILNSNNNAIVGMSVDKDEIIKLIDKFCNKEDVIGVPTPKLFQIFDEFCEKQNSPKISHLTLGRIFREHFGLTRKKVRSGKNLYWVYVSKT